MPIEIGFTFGMRRSKNTYSMELEKTFLLLKHKSALMVQLLKLVQKLFALFLFQTNFVN